MTAFLIGLVTIKNEDLFHEYVQKAIPTIEQHNGTILTKGVFHASISGDLPAHDSAIAISFPDMDSLNNWYNSEEYQSIIPLRDAGASVEIFSYST